MRDLRLIVEDIRQGDNVDLYLTVLAALVLGGLNLFGHPSDQLATSLTVAVLALLAYGLLGNRRKLDQLLSAVALMQGGEGLLSAFPKEFVPDLEDAKTIYLVGTHLHSTLTSHYALLKKKIMSGCKLRVLLVDPDGAACGMAAMRFAAGLDAEHERTTIRGSLASFSELRAMAPTRVDIRVIDFLLDYTAYMFNMDDPSAIIYMERNTFKTSGGAMKPKFVFTGRDRGWFEHTRTEANALWEAGRPFAQENAEAG